MNMHQDWEEAYRAAVLETDHHKLIDKIESATTVLRESLLEASSSPEHLSERRRIEDALRTLDMIRRIELQFIMASAIMERAEFPVHRNKTLNCPCIGVSSIAAVWPAARFVSLW